MSYPLTTGVLQSAETPTSEQYAAAILENTASDNKANAAFNLTRLASRQALDGAAVETITATLNALEPGAGKVAVETVQVVLNNSRQALNGHFLGSFQGILQGAGYLKLG